MYKILIADDDKDFVQVLGQRLRAEGLSTIVAYEGVRAIEAVNREHPDLVLLDIRMPAGSGQSVLKTLRAKQDTAEIPVIVMTGHPITGLEQDVREAGAQGFFAKPFEFDDLIRSIWELMGESTLPMQ